MQVRLTMVNRSSSGQKVILRMAMLFLVAFMMHGILAAVVPVKWKKFNACSLPFNLLQAVKLFVFFFLLVMMLVDERLRQGFGVFRDSNDAAVAKLTVALTASILHTFLCVWTMFATVSFFKAKSCTWGELSSTGLWLLKSYLFLTYSASKLEPQMVSVRVLL